ncbi:Ubiquinone biosynthesis protein coq9, mitochondrial [Xylographa opegraphella]|nr:Ubiquinone biosynthesis protein coq9, mitochondrial [Xylographa opegraphella]
MAASRTRCPRLSRLRGPTLTKPSIASPFHRYYHSYEHDPEPPFTDTEDSILSAALNHVPSQGFTTLALTHGAEDAGYLDVSTNLFPRGPFDLINYHLVTQRLALKDRIQFPDPSIGVGAKVRALALQRLKANKEIIHRWPEALAIMALPSNISPSIAELARLSDEIWFLAGDTSVDTSWYTKRASLSAVYSSTELFMTTDTSANHGATEFFLDRRLGEVQSMGKAVGSVGQWMGFTAAATINVLRSKGVRI